MSQEDYYNILEVDKSASQDELKRAYRKMAMKYHPDRNPGNEEAEKKFKELNEAYDVLSDQQKRAAYDQYGHAAFQQGGGGQGHGFSGFSGFSDIFDEMFGDMMGGGRNRQARMRGADLRYDIDITLEEAFKGFKKQIQIPTKIVCDACKGSGSASQEGPIACTTCNGIGKVRMQQGFFTIERTCPNCDGTGQMIKDPCRKCHGVGVVHGQKNLNVEIPAGIDGGMRIRLTGEGEAGPRGSSSGDLYVFVNIKEHDLFARNQDDLYCRIPIPMTTAVMGGEISVPTIDGTSAKIDIPAGTQNEHRMRLKNKGMSVLRTQQRGHLYIELIVEIPVKLNKRQKDIMEEFEKEYRKNEAKQKPNQGGFFSKMRNLWDDLTD